MFSCSASVTWPQHGLYRQMKVNSYGTTTVDICLVWMFGCLLNQHQTSYPSASMGVGRFTTQPKFDSKRVNGHKKTSAIFQCMKILPTTRQQKTFNERELNDGLIHNFRTPTRHSASFRHTKHKKNNSCVLNTYPATILISKKAAELTKMKARRQR